MIQLKQITKDYCIGESVVHALSEVNLSIADGEFVGIVGPSGSGKSTLMNILGVLDTADAGEYLLDGSAVAAMSDSDLARLRNRRIGFVFQNFNLIGRMTVAENVELPLIYQGVKAAERRSRVAEVLQQVGLGERGHHTPNTISGGQQQRAAIARALVTAPTLLLADEPTGNLDSQTGAEIMQLLRQLNAEGHTIVLITHDHDIAVQAGRLVYIRDGQLSEAPANHDTSLGGALDLALSPTGAPPSSPDIAGLTRNLNAPSPSSALSSSSVIAGLTRNLNAPSPTSALSSNPNSCAAETNPTAETDAAAETSPADDADGAAGMTPAAETDAAAETTPADDADAAVGARSAPAQLQEGDAQ